MQRQALYPFVAARTPRKKAAPVSPPPGLSANCASPSLLARHGGSGMQTALIMTFTVYSLPSRGSPVLRQRNAGAEGSATGLPRRPDRSEHSVQAA